MDDRTTAAGTGAEHWRGVLLTGAGAAAGSVVFIVVQIAVFALHPPPASVDGFFVLMDENPLLGMLSLDLLLSVNNVLVALVYLALIVVLWDRARSTAAIAGLLMVLGMAAYLTYCLFKADYSFLKFLLGSPNRLDMQNHAKLQLPSNTSTKSA